MVKIRIVSQKDAESLLAMPQVIDAVEQAYILKAQKDAALFPMVFHDFAPKEAGDMDIKSGVLNKAGIFGLKLVSWFGNNTEYHLPQLFGTIAIFDSKTGKPLGLLNGNAITGMRTGAAGAIGAKYLAKKNAKTLLIVGTGHQAKYQLQATLLALPQIETVLIYNPHDVKKAEQYVQHIKTALDGIMPPNTKFQAVADLEQAVGNSDIIITVTPSYQPLIQKNWVKEGTHFSCIGADMAGKQEIDEAIFTDAKLFVDDMEQAIHVGECEIPIKKGSIHKDSILGEIGEVILGQKPGRSDEKEITIFDSTGIALQDLICAKLLLDLATEKNLGTIAEL